MPFPPYSEYRGHCRYVTDGDTVDLLVDKGLNKYDYETFRLKDVDAREIHGGTLATKAAAQEDKRFVEARILHQPVRVRTFKDLATFGRYVAEIWYWDAGGAEHCLNEEIAEHLAATPVLE